MLCRTEAIDHMGMGFKHPIIHLPVRTHSMVLSTELAVVAFRGVEAVAEHLVAAEGFIVGSGNAWGPSMEPNGDQSKFLGKYLLKVDPHYCLFSGRYQYSSLKTF